MAATPLPKPDFAFFEVWQDDTEKVIHYRRITSRRDVSGPYHATAYFDANLLEDALAKSGGKITRSAIPGDWALNQATSDPTFVDGYTHYHDYTVKFI